MSDGDEDGDGDADGDRLDPMEVAAVRKLLHAGAEVVTEDGREVGSLTPVEKATAVADHLDSLTTELRETRDAVYLLTLFSDDGPTKQARKMTVVDHLREKAEETATGKTHVKAEVTATLTEVSERQARRYMDELAAEVPGCTVREAEDVGASKQLRFDLRTYRAEARSRGHVSSA
jgi:hypothetical protein